MVADEVTLGDQPGRRQRATSRTPVPRPQAHGGTAKPLVGAAGESTAARQQAPGLEHGGLIAELTHVHVRHAGGTTLVTQLPAPLSDSGGGLAELRACGAAVLRLGSPVAGEVLD